MPRSFLALFGCLFLAGCASSLPPEPPEPPRPIVVVDREDPIDPPQARSEDDTRQSALVVFAAEQRTLVGTLEGEMRFVRTSSGRQERLRDVLLTSDRELTSIERAVDALGRDDDLSPAERRSRHDELKDRLRRLATRLSLVETAIRER